jgi:excisionase family DNA binding protein
LIDMGGGFKADDALKAARELPPEDLPALIGQLEAAKATAWARLTAPAPAQTEHDELLNVAEAARRLGVSEDYLYGHHREYPFTRRQGRKLLFSAQGIDRFIRQK